MASQMYQKSTSTPTVERHVHPYVQYPQRLRSTLRSNYEQSETSMTTPT